MMSFPVASFPPRWKRRTTVLLVALLRSLTPEVAEKANLGYITGDEQKQKSSHPETQAQD
jgi:hypothetical protein